MISEEVLKALKRKGAVLGYEEICERLSSLEEWGVGLSVPEILALPPEKRPAVLNEPRMTGRIIIEPPFTPEEIDQKSEIGRVKQASIDFEMGDAVRELDPKKIPKGFAIRMSDPETMKQYDEMCPIRELHAGDVVRLEQLSCVRARSARYILLPHDLVGLLWGRSVTARFFLKVHVSAPKFDPGFAGRAVFELVSLGKMPIELGPGDVISQMMFLRTGGIGEAYDVLRTGLLERQSSMRHAFSPGRSGGGPRMPYALQDALLERQLTTSGLMLPWIDEEEL